jgi:hypothetical protein
MEAGKGIGFHLFTPLLKNKKWLWKRKNVTITISGKHSPVTAGLPTHISDEAVPCLLRLLPNDRLSPTDTVLDAYGIG